MASNLKDWIRLLHDLWAGNLSAIYARRTEKGEVYVETFEASETQKYSAPERSRRKNVAPQ